MSQLQPKYKFYPSLLDKFEQYLRADEQVESFWNIDNETGEYKKTHDEIEAELKQSLLDSINRVPFESEAADKGTAFNEIVDCYIHKRKHVPTERNNFTIIGDEETNAVQAYFPATALAPERNFLFDRNWCIEVSEYFKGAVSQLFVSATIPTRYGDVELYGFIDELLRDVVYDIKTTSKYEFGKYAHGWQRHVYPYCLIASGQMENVKAFEYTAFALKGGTSRTPLISGTPYPEYYTYNHEQTVKCLTAHCERFIEFVEANRALITDKKIFGKENE
ncbi:MAG: HNH endonuclease [Bacteroides sp.]|uniref:HNH endonuclease n=1 Tax=Bacteroides sp. TaxID=29523 RepID=UPI002FCA9BF9